jgi:alkanesulfonate monooxygenase SsuD/methylene tetrahydromethanopterin reductase-like flavin-dependent oxidoreductase (luciferase family)
LVGADGPGGDHDGAAFGRAVDHAEVLELGERFADRAAGQAVGVAQLVFGGEPVADRKVPAGDLGAQRFGLAGRAFDEVVLHTFFTDETTARCVTTVKQAAEQVGRDPAAVKVWSCFATIGDHVPDEWFAPAATGTPEQCVAAVRNQFDLGCDGVILHGATPAELTPIITAYRNQPA